MEHNIKRIAVFASGRGTNAQNLISFFSKNDTGRVTLVLSDKKEAGVISRVKDMGVEVVVFDCEELRDGTILALLQKHEIDFIVLAGFLRMVPMDIIEKYRHRIVNIHPSLLPKYGGRGMYGMNIHRAVIENREKESGITIHQVSEACDEGDIIFQTNVEITDADTPESLAAKISCLEMEHFPRVVEKIISSLELQS